MHGALRLQREHRLGWRPPTQIQASFRAGSPQPVVSQIFCSNSRCHIPKCPQIPWRAFASLVRESAYEATMWAAWEHPVRGQSVIVLLTSLGGGAFGNSKEWDAMRRTFQLAAGVPTLARSCNCRRICLAHLIASPSRRSRGRSCRHRPFALLHALSPHPAAAGAG